MLGTEDSGKITLDQIYDQTDPRAYFGTLRGLGYCIPQLAKPHFQQVIQDYRHAHGVAAPTVLDMGCSYGINAALLRCDATLSELYARYCHCGYEDHAALVSRDREFVRTRGKPDGPGFVGLDSSLKAVSYAVDAGFIDEGVHADLEARDLSEDQRATVASADVVISTGCVGYVTDRTITRIAVAHPERRPWMAHFVLRMFAFDSVAEGLAEVGYRTVRHEGVFRQRRFATDDECSQVLDALADVGVDPSGLETDGWLYAQLFISRPVQPSRGRK